MQNPGLSSWCWQGLVVFAIGTLSCSPRAEPNTGRASSTVAAARSGQATELSPSSRGGSPRRPGRRGGRTVRRTVFLVLDQPAVVTRMRRGDVFDPQLYRQQLTRVQDGLAPRITAYGARVVGRLTRLANALLVVAPTDVLNRLGRLPGIRRVEPAPLDRPHSAESVPLVGAPALWQAPVDVLGRGIRVGVIDSGIDYTHAAFGGSGLVIDYQTNDPSVIEPGSFPTARVVGGYDFAGDLYDAGDPSHDLPEPDPDPLDCPRPESSGHGSHVAGILASGGVTSDGSSYTGPYDVSLDPTAFVVYPGVAPAAELYALKVFGCAPDGTTSLTGLALEWAADPNDDGLFDDRLDVVNLSLGAKYGLSSTSHTVVENLVYLGTVVVASAGNTDSSVRRVRPFFLIDAPAVAHPVIAVANSFKTEVRFRSLTIAGAPLGPFPLTEGRDNPGLDTTGTVSGVLVRPTERTGCDPFENAADFPGTIALLDRGDCTFNTKFGNAEAAGAVAAVVVDYSDADVPWEMTGIEAALPGGLITTPHGEALHAALDGGATLTATLDAAAWYPQTIGPDYIRNNSCRGPSVLDGLVKPDVAAPGASIVSVASGLGYESVIKSGTSMSAPHVSGAAALLREADQTLTPAEVKARLMSTAATPTDLTGAPFPVSLAGAGRIQVLEALQTPAYLVTLDATGVPSSLVNVSFGTHVTDAPFELERTVQVVNPSPDALSFQVAIAPGRALSGATVTATPSTVSVPAGGTAAILVRLAVDPAALPPPSLDNVTPKVGYRDVGRHFVVECDGRVLLTPTSPTTIPSLSLPYHAMLRGAGRRQAATPRGCTPAQGPSVVEVPLTGSAVLDASPVVSAFVHLPGAASYPLIALGVSHNLASAETDPNLIPALYFGMATALQWPVPARFNRSAVGLHLDLDADGEPDFQVAMDSETESGDDDFGNADIFSVRVYPYYEGAGEDYTPARVNVVDPRVLQTHAHLNSVYVLPVPLEELELEPATLPPVLGVRAWARTVDDLRGDVGAWVSFDPRELPLDPTVAGQVADPFGPTPMYGGDHVLVSLVPDAGAAGQLAPDLLLLHHTNVLSQRLEVVSLAEADNAYEQGDLAVSVQGSPVLVANGSRATAAFVVTNHGPGALAEVGLEIQIGAVGGNLGSITLTPDAGSCSGPDANLLVRCELGTLEEAGEVQVTVSLSLDLWPLPLMPGLVTLTGQVSTGLGCPAPVANDTARFEIGVLIIEGEDQPRSGCGCGAGNSGSAFWLPLILLAWLLRRARARSRCRLP